MKTFTQAQARRLCILVGIVAFLAGISVAITSSPRAQQRGTELRAETGTCKHDVATDGLFYQSPYQTNNQLNPSCSTVSLAGMFDETRGWRIGYHDFGTIRARDNRFMRRDDEVRAVTGPCDPATLSGCKGTMYGDGYMRGVSFSLTKREPLRSNIDFTWEAGLLFFESEFNAWATKDEAPGILYVTERSSIFNRPDLVLGAGLRWQDFYITARKNFSLQHRAQSLTDFNVVEVMAGFAFPL